MQWIEANETQTERRQNDFYAFIFECALLAMVLLLLSFTAHAQVSNEAHKNVEWNEVQIGTTSVTQPTAGTLSNSQPVENKLQDAQKTQNSSEQKPVVATQVAAAQQTQAPRKVIVVSVKHRKLALMEDGKVKKIYTIAVGKRSTPTPSGTFYIVSRVDQPMWSHKGKVVEPGPANPVGSRWIGLSAKGYGIHGTNEPNSIGKAASHGCIRMAKADIEDLFTLVNVGDEVDIHTSQDDEVSAIFDAQPEAQTTQTAANVMTGPANGQL